MSPRDGRSDPTKEDSGRPPTSGRVRPEPGAPEPDRPVTSGAPASFTDDDRWIDELEELADAQARAIGVRPQVEFEVPGLRVTADIGGPEPDAEAYGAPEATRPASGAGGPAAPPTAGAASPARRTPRQPARRTGGNGGE
ncbi:MAG TPA: translation initiation factor 2 [Thermaerobacter sp.]